MKNTHNTNTIGIDLGDKSHETCTLNQAGEVIARFTVLNIKEELIRFSEENQGATIIMEAGTHSPWISRLLKERSHKVIVANPRKVRAIYDTDNKNDERDAELLARIGRFDANLLYAISHKSEEDQRALKIMDMRDTLVATRVRLVNSVRGTLKSLGIILESGWSTEAFARKSTVSLKPEDYKLVSHLIETIAQVSEHIKALDKDIDQMIRTEYTQAQKFQTIPGVGPITALAFTLVVGNPERFSSARDMGPFLGLVPKRDQSGDSDKPLRITKAGNRTLRRLLVSCAQYTLSRHGPPSALKTSGERIAKAGAKIAKKKSVVATARKLAVLMLALWKDDQSQYKAFPNAKEQQKAA